MAHKKELSQEEKVAEILKRANVTFDPAKAREYVALNTRCKRCGRNLSSLERITFEDKCEQCMVDETNTRRDKFFRKYIILAFVFIAMIVLGGFCANSREEIMTIIGTVVSSVVVGVSLVYVFYTNMDKMFPRVPPKAQVWVCFIIALVIDLILSLFMVVLNSWILYVLFLVMVGCYVAYIGYGEFILLKEKFNYIDVYRRKSQDKEYVESITEAIEKRQREMEELIKSRNAEEESERLAAEGDLDDASDPVEDAPELQEATPIKEGEGENIAIPETAEEEKKAGAEVDNVADVPDETQSEDVDDDSNDNAGDFYI